jgi:hypothetical protein
MFTPNGFILPKSHAIALFFILLLPQKTDCQTTILDSLFTFRAGIIKRGEALDIIAGRTGYNFTYDSRLVDREKKTVMNFHDTRLKSILDTILQNDSLVFSVIDKYIIISRAEIASASTTDSQRAITFNYLTGTIVDDESREPLAYATLGLKNNGKGTITNNNGEFGLKVSSDLLNDTLSVSYLGYIRREIPLRQALGNNFTISMKREFISIPEIIIRNQIPQEIISRAIKAISLNYGNTPAYLTGFYREGVLNKHELQNYSEAILQIYKSAYSGSLFYDQVKVLKSRKTENTDQRDTLTVRFKAGLNTCLELDGVRNTFDFLKRESMADYSYRITDIVTYDDEMAYAIDFEQRKEVDLPLYRGTVYINTLDYSIPYAEFELNPELIHKMKDSFVANGSRGFTTLPLSVKYSVSYRKVNGRYFLSHVRGDLVFSSSQKKRLFKSQFTVFFELAVTETDLLNVSRFEKEELAPVHSIFSKTITNYDPLFWGSMDFIRPEDNLLQALKNMKVKLQEFSK